MSCQGVSTYSPSPFARCQRSTSPAWTKLFYYFAKETGSEEQYRLFEHNFRWIFSETQQLPWGIEQNWFTLTDSCGRTLLVRELRHAEGDTPWSRWLAWRMPREALMQRDCFGENACKLAAVHGAFGTLTTILQRQPESYIEVEGALLSCMRDGHKELARMLWQQKLPETELTRQDKTGKDALDWAWQQGWMDVVALLVPCYPTGRLIKLNKQGETLLERAVRGEHGTIVRLLMDQIPSESWLPGPPYSGRNSRVLEWAIRWASDQVLADLIDEFPQEELLKCDGSRSGYNGWLYLAHRYDRGIHIWPLVRRICDSGIDHWGIDVDNEKVMGLLHDVVACGDTEMLGVFLKSLRGSEDLLLLAISKRDEETALLLMAHRFWRRFRDLRALHLAADHGMARLVEALVDALADTIDTYSMVSARESRTPLHLAAAKGHDEVVRILVKWMAPRLVAELDEKNRTALHYGVEAGLSVRVVQEVMERMPPEHLIARDEKGDTILHLAFRQYKDAVEGLPGRVESCNRVGCNERAVISAILEKVPPDLFWAWNNNDETPMDLADRCPDRTFSQRMRRKLEADDLPENLPSSFQRMEQIIRARSMGKHELAQLWACELLLEGGPVLEINEAALFELHTKYPRGLHDLYSSSSETLRYNIVVRSGGTQLAPLQALKIAYCCGHDRILSIFTASLSLAQPLSGTENEMLERCLHKDHASLREIPPDRIAIAWQYNTHYRSMFEMHSGCLSYGQRNLLRSLEKWNRLVAKDDLKSTTLS